MTPRIFTCSPPPKALVTLILIENSHTIFPFWNDLRQHYLPTLLGTMRIANPVIPIPVLWLTTAPIGDDPASIRSPPPRQYNQLPELKFSFTSDNKITSRIVYRAIELMLEAASPFRDGSVNFHLFIVAASSPLHANWSGSLTMSDQTSQSDPEWRLLGQRIAQLGIHCHMILPGSQDMTPLNQVFSTSLHLQGRFQVAPWFQTSSDYTFLLSGDSSGDPTPDPSTEPIEKVRTVSADLPQQSVPVPRPPVLRHQSFPQDAANPSVQNMSTPILVNSLQKVHGLNRKKLYGAQPPRQPFVREEPVRSKYKSTPTPLSIPVGAQPFPISEDGRVLAKSKVDRGRRAERHVGDASNSCSPGRKSPWNHVPGSDVGSSPSSPTNSHSSHQTTSPTIPLYPDMTGYPANPPTTSAPFSPGMVSPASISETKFPSPLGDPSVGYLPPYQSPVIPVSSAPAWPPMSKPISSVPIVKSAITPSSSKRHSQEIPMQSLSAMSTKYRLDAVPTEPRVKNVQKVKDAGDMPFIFSAELEAATAAKLKAALQSTPPASSLNPYSAFTSGDQLNYEETYVSSPLVSATTPIGYNTMADARPTGLVDGEGDARARFIPASSSSLQGWAG